ncbi:unnamed protein product, partial [Prorocentrum cordatum]
MRDFATLEGYLGGILNVHRCLLRGRISFVGRTEFVADDAVGLYRATVGPALDDAHGAGLWLNANASAPHRSAEQARQEIGEAGSRALSAFLAEDSGLLHPVAAGLARHAAALVPPAPRRAAGRPAHWRPRGRLRTR